MSEPTYCDVNCGEIHQVGCPEKNKEIFSKLEESRELIEMCGRLQTSLSQEQARNSKYKEALETIVNDDQACIYGPCSHMKATARAALENEEAGGK